LLPFTVNANPAPPAAADEGKIDSPDGVGELTANGASVEAPPPSGGFTTVITACCAAAISAAVMVASSRVLLIKVAVRLFPFHWIVAPGTKFAPATVRVNASPPAVADLGESAEIEGTGLMIEVDVTLDESDFFVSAADVAVTVIEPVAREGVRRPEAEIEPAEDDHFTTLVKNPVPLTVAMHWSVPV
jgi:hypothetical protein